jgi:hypothetical protein
MGRAGKYTGLIGKRFGLLEVRVLSRIVHTTRFGKPIGFTRYYLCKCDCGGSIIVRETHLTEKRKANIQKSCGCLVKELHKSASWHTKSRKEGTAFRRCLDQYKANARNRGLSWELTDDQFREITTSPCHYTGEAPSTVKKSRCEEYVHNGIDRIDNNKGYITENCVPCCAIINQMKADLSLKRFLELCKKVSERTQCEQPNNQQ